MLKSLVTPFTRHNMDVGTIWVTAIFKLKFRFSSDRKIIQINVCQNLIVLAVPDNTL